MMLLFFFFRSAADSFQWNGSTGIRYRIGRELVALVLGGWSFLTVSFQWNFLAL